MNLDRKHHQRKYWKPSRKPYSAGFIFSLVVHVIGAFIFLLILENKAATATRAPDVFTVTLEAGKTLGGISQVPKKKGKSASKKTIKKEAAKKKAKKPLEKPSVVKDPEKEKKKAAAKKKAEQKKKAAAEKKKKAQESKLQEEELKKRKAKEKAEREKQLQEAIDKAKDRFEGESTNVGGQGMGAAATGGQGTGGGTLESLEFVAYKNALEAHIKSGWHWVSGVKVLRAQVGVVILPTGVIQDARIYNSSGNVNFDDSVLRAVFKSSPVPTAPEKLYTRFREVMITFDSDQ